jgi:hypothetical protein
MKTLRGLYREHANGDLPDQVYISHGAHGHPVSEAYYQVYCFEPEMASLPWKEDYAKPVGDAPAQ